MGIYNYTDEYGDDIPGKGNIAFDRGHFDNVIHGFQHHKVMAKQRRDQYQANAEYIRELAAMNRELVKEIYT